MVFYGDYELGSPPHKEVTKLTLPSSEAACLPQAGFSPASPAGEKGRISEAGMCRKTKRH